MALALAACQGSDVGKNCEALLNGQDPTIGTGRTETLEVVGQSACYPCEELICVASDGRSGYCSKKCRDDSGCPVGFECRVVQTLGQFANETFCTWKRCTNDDDCGAPGVLRCREVPGTDPVNNEKLCEYIDSNVFPPDDGTVSCNAP